MSGFPSALWLLGLGSPNPTISPAAASPIVGIAGTLSGLPALSGTLLAPAAQPAGMGFAGTLAALPAWFGDNGVCNALPATTGAVYG